jgi:hypothetical protein
MELSVVSCIFVVFFPLCLGLCDKAYTYAKATCAILYTSARFTFSFANASQPFKCDESIVPFKSSLQ